MPPDEYSDSGESDAQEYKTSVLLGVPDGPILSKSDISKLRISRIGGKPVSIISFRTQYPMPIYLS